MTKAFFGFLDWCGRHSALLVAIAGFASSAAIAKISSGLDIKRTLCLRRFEAYEKATRQLMLKLNVYANILAAFQLFRETVPDIGVIKGRAALLLSSFAQLGTIEQQDPNIVGVFMYSKIPSYDIRPLLEEMALFIVVLNDFSSQLNLPISEDILKQSTQRFIESVNRLEPLVAKEFNHLNALYVKLNDEVHKDRMFKKLLRHSR